MAKKNKPNLKEALKKIDKMPKELFGTIEIDISTLPSLKKPRKEKITANFDADVLQAIREIAEEHNVSYTSLMNDVLRKVFLKDKEAG